MTPEYAVKASLGPLGPEYLNLLFCPPDLQNLRLSSARCGICYLSTRITIAPQSILFYLLSPITEPSNTKALAFVCRPRNIPIWQPESHPNVSHY